MGHCQTSGFFRVIGKISLRIQIRMVSYDLHGRFVGPYCTVAAQPPELAAYFSLFFNGERFCGKRCICHIIFNADGKTLFALIGKYRMDLFRRGIFGAQPISACIDRDILEIAAPQRSQYIQIQRFPYASRFFGPVQYRDLFHCLGNRRQQAPLVKRTIKTYFNKARFSSVPVFHIHHFLNGLADASHSDDNMLCLRIAIVLEQFIGRACLSRDLLEQCFHDIRQFFITGIRRLPILEKYIRILSRSHLSAMRRVQRSCPERGKRLPVQQFFIIRPVPYLDFLYLMRRPKAVEKMQKGRTSLQCGNMRYRRQVHDLLHAAGRQDRHTGLSACIHIGMIPENG